MALLQTQGDLTNVEEVQVSSLPFKTFKRSADNASPECVKKPKAADEVQCNSLHEKGDSLSKQLYQRKTDTPEDEIKSQIESNNPQSPEESLQSFDYYCSEMKFHEQDEERLVTIRNFSFDPVILRRELSKMIILHEYPLSVVDHIGFRDFLRIVNPLFKMVSQNTVENDIMKIFKFERCEAYTALNGDSSGRVAVTTKMWKSSDVSRRFLAITGHIIDEDWKRQSFIMRFANVPLPCTNESISKVILDCISYFDVHEKLSTITVDSYTSDDKLVDILVDKLPGKKFLFRKKLFRLPCFAHTMSLMVEDGFDMVRPVIEKIQDSIVFWTSSPEREVTFEKVAHELGVITTAKLVLNHGLSWSSTYLMLQDSFIFKDVFSHLGKQESQYNSFPTKEEWDLAREVCNRLELLYDVMKILADLPDACMYFVHLSGIKMTLTEWIDCEVPGIKEMASKMVEKFDKYWFAARDILGVASVLHPKYRFFSLKLFFQKIYGNESEIEVERIRQIFFDLFNEYRSSLPVHESSDEELRSRLSFMEYKFMLYLREKKKEELEQCEVDLYLKDYFDQETKDFDILSWWGGRKTRYPVLHKMAKDILAIPILSVDVEHAFDVGDKILGANRSRLRPTMVEALMCTQSWVRRRKHLDAKGTIYDDSNVEYGIVIKDKTAEPAV